MVFIDNNRKYVINSTQQSKLKEHCKHVKSRLCVKSSALLIFHIKLSISGLILLK